MLQTLKPMKIARNLIRGLVSEVDEEEEGEGVDLEDGESGKILQKINWMVLRLIATLCLDSFIKMEYIFIALDFEVAEIINSKNRK